MKDKIREREKAFEEEFFARRDRELVARMRGEVERAEGREELSEATGIGDVALLEQLLELGVSAENVAALSVVPLVFVAWSDHRMRDVEKHSVLEASKDLGLPASGAPHAMLEAWLQERPAPRLFEVWSEWLTATARALPETERALLRDRILNLCRDVAHAAGGVLETGVPMDREERDVIGEIETIFDRIGG